jgi:hypothetical protein
VLGVGGGEGEGVAGWLGHFGVLFREFIDNPDRGPVVDWFVCRWVVRRLIRLCEDPVVTMSTS